ncbi:MAG: MmgE/PrpD family protein [Thermodesulfobacteriota bacterium]|nr:MmgE/PrpD family protein [Thermodesulfobacteriota bacterium]
MLKLNKSNLNLEYKLIDHITTVRYEDLPPEAVDCCKLLIMDALGVTFPGSQAPGCTEVADLAHAWKSESGASVLIHGDKTLPPFAAMVNSTMMHALDFDDTLDASALHTFVNVLPAAMAAAETVGSIDGKRFMTALILGVDVICRLSMGIRRPLSWIRTATCGSFGAATTVGKILGLDYEQMTNALGVAYSQTAGNAQGLLEGRLVKRMQPGFAAQAGLTSAFLAERGITGSHAFLEGTYGFYNLYEQGEFDHQPIVERLGSHYTITDLSIKPYPSCRMTHASIDAALELRDVIGGDVEDIDQIEVNASKMVTEMVGKPFVIGTNPQVDAQFSIPYTVACAMVRGDVFIGDFETEAIHDTQVKSLADRVTVSVNSDLLDKDILHAGLVIKMNDGRTHEKTVNVPLGNPEKSMDVEQCKQKFRKCVAYSGLDFDKSKIEDLLSMIDSLEHIQDINRMIALMLP